MPTFLRRAATLLALLLPILSAAAEPAIDAAGSARLAAEVKQEFLHAWQGYRRYAWGHDDLAPLSRRPHDWYAGPLLMTPVDALDTLILMGLDDDAAAARELIATKLDLDQDVYVKNFEITIRLLGGLLSAYQMTHDERLLAKADDLGARLLPAFDSPTGLPYVEVNLRTGKARGKATNPAETGTLLLEFGSLAKLTGKPAYYDKAKRALVETWKRRSPLGLVGASIDVETGRWLDPEASIAGGIDSYDEYLWKCWRLFGDEDCLAMWKPTIAAANRYLADEVDGALWYGYADMNTGRRTRTWYGALDAFFPALLALSGDVPRAARLQDSSFAMWQAEGIEPEIYDYRARRIAYQGYALRPEIVESTYYLSHYTHDPKYLAMGRTMFRDFVRHCRTGAGYAALSDVTTKAQKDRMESFVFAETFKYYYLLFAPQALDFDAVTFNTEAHPLRATWAAGKAQADPAAEVDPRIGSAHGGNTFPGAVAPFGMVAFSPETTRGDHARVAASGGYAYDATRIRGFGLTHLSGAGCRGASGDVPFMPVTFDPSSSPSADAKDAVYAESFSHANETAEPGYYAVALANRVRAEFTASPRTGAARLRYPPGAPAVLLVRASDSETGSRDAEVAIDAKAGRVSGSVTAGNFCGHLDAEDRRSYYTLYFVAEFDRPVVAHGAWHDGAMAPGAAQARGGTGYGKDGYPEPGRGSGAWLRFDTAGGRTVGLRVGISYVSLANAAANLAAENPAGASFDALRAAARDAWNRELSRIRIDGGDAAARRTFYTALYHSLLHPNLFSDANGEYAGFDGATHRVAAPQAAQYANFSEWDIYRSQIQLVTLLDPRRGGDIAQSMLNQANQNGGVWDRWTHNTGNTHVMNGDPAPAVVAAIHAFGGTGFDARAALASLLRAATVPTALDGSARGCPIECAGQRPGLDRWLKLGYIPAQSHAWGAAAEMLEQGAADFALAAFAARLGDAESARRLLARSGDWRRLFNPQATPHGGYVQNRNTDGTWPAFDPASDDGFVEGSAAQYLWMLPYDAKGLIEALGGEANAVARLDAFFRDEDGGWALTGLGGLHAEMDNEPSIGAPWMYLYAGRPWKAQETVRAVLDALWKPAPDGIPGNDDLGEMSSWYVWSALGLYPMLPGRADLAVGSPRFPHAEIRRGEASIVLDAPAAADGARYVRGLRVDGRPSTRAWLPDAFVARGGRLDFDLSPVPEKSWGAAEADRPPSYR